MKHTQGPWTLDFMNSTRVMHKSELHGNKNGYAQIANCSGDTSKSLEERNANAKLIAHLPDILEALERLSIEVRRAHVDGEGLIPGCNVCEALKNSESVINKAKK